MEEESGRYMKPRPGEIFATAAQYEYPVDEMLRGIYDYRDYAGTHASRMGTLKMEKILQSMKTLRDVAISRDKQKI